MTLAYALCLGAAARASPAGQARARGLQAQQAALTGDGSVLASEFGAQLLLLLKTKRSDVLTELLLLARTGF